MKGEKEFCWRMFILIVWWYQRVMCTYVWDFRLIKEVRYISNLLLKFVVFEYFFLKSLIRGETSFGFFLTQYFEYFVEVLEYCHRKWNNICVIESLSAEYGSVLEILALNFLFVQKKLQQCYDTTEYNRKMQEIYTLAVFSYQDYIRKR